MKGFNDPEYIKSLQKREMHFLKNRKYRVFLADGDSMPPFTDQSIIIGEHVEKLEDIKPNKEYIFKEKQKNPLQYQRILFTNPMKFRLVKFRKYGYV